MKTFYTHIKYLFSVYILGIILFSFIRFGLLISQWGQIDGFPTPFLLLIRSFLMGFRFDTVISGYILLLPLVVLLLLSIVGIEKREIAKLFHVYLCVGYSFLLIFCVADIPYFNEFFRHLNASVFNWIDDKGFVLGMIKDDSAYSLYLLFALFLAAVFCVLTSFIFKKFYKNFVSSIQVRYSLKITGGKFAVFVLLVGICLIGIRGRVEQKSPIRVGTAFFCNYAFPNQLGLNPVFYFINTIIDSKKESSQKVQLMPDEEAIDLVRKFYHVTDSLPSPIARMVKPTNERKNCNVVVIIMEGMAAEYMKRHGNEHSQTPFLDSLSHQSIYFENYYTAGIHTMNGIFSTLFSYPALFIQHPMKSSKISQYMGLPFELKKKGYQTAYFTTHDDQFDNVGGFLSMNDIEFVMSQKDYPASKVVGPLGVPDDYMFEQAIVELNRMSDQKKPFFVSMMTASNHGPIVVPNYFKPKSKELKNQIVEYSDWALQKFFNMAKREKWFNNTIFIFTADHGAFVGEQPYEISLSRLHSPFIIYQSGKKPELKTTVASQLDIFPTVMGLLNIPYINNTFGIDLFAEKRQYALLNSDNVVACVGDSVMYVYSTQTKMEGLYEYKLKKTENLIQKQPEKACEMKQFLFSTMQSAQYIIDKDLTKF